MNDTHWLLNYFRKTKHYSKTRFIIEMTLVAFLLKMVFGLLFYMITGSSDEVDQGVGDMLSDGWIWTTVYLIIFASFETLVGQWLVISTVEKFTNNLFAKIFTSTVFFSVLHVDLSLIVIVFPIGIILAWSFILYRRESRWSAFWVTTAIHVLHNVIAVSLFYFDK